MGSPFWCTKHPNAPTLRCLPLRFVLITVQIVYIYGIPPCSPEVPHSGPCKKRSILQRDRASTAAGGQNCRAPYHSKSRHGENDAPLLRKTAKSDSERSLGTSEGHRWRRRIICRQLELQNTPKKCTAHPIGPIAAWRKIGPQHPPDAFPRKSRLN